MKNYLKKIGSNRRLAAGRLEIDFKKPFNLLANLPAEARGEAPSEAANSIWWTRGESNPLLFHAMEMCCQYTTGPYALGRNRTYIRTLGVCCSVH